MRDLPFNIVKLDRTFISDGTDNERGQIVARNTIALARDLRMRVVAEGVETLTRPFSPQQRLQLRPKATTIPAPWTPRSLKC